MADMKNTDPNKSTPAKPAEGTSKVSAGTSVGDIGTSPMPHAQGGSASSANKPGQGAASASQGSQTGSDHREKSGSQGDQGLTEKAKDAVQSATEAVRSSAGDAQKKVSEVADQASDWAQDTYDRASSWAGDTYGNSGERLQQVRGRSAKALGSARNTVQDYVAENPMVVGIVGLAAGLLIGALLPRTRKENEAFGEWADEVREQGLRYAQDATQRGREYVEETFTGDDPRFGRHEADFRSDRNANRH